MTRSKLEVVKRELFGRKIKKLRAEGILPANIYGKKVKSLAVQLATGKFMPVYKEAGETGVVDVSVKGEKDARPVLIHNVQFHPVTDEPVHVDFHQVSLTEKIQAEIPLELVGESPAAEKNLGILVRLVDVVEVEALPTDLPERIEIDVSSLEKVGDMVDLGSLKLDEKKVKLVTDKTTVVAKIDAQAEEEEPVKEEEPVEGEEGEDEGKKEGEEEGKKESTEGESAAAEEETKTSDDDQKKP